MTSSLESNLQLAPALHAPASQWLHAVLVEQQTSDKVVTQLLRNLPQVQHPQLVQWGGTVLRQLNLCWTLVHNEPLPTLPLPAHLVSQLTATLANVWTTAVRSRYQALQSAGPQALLDGCPQWLDELASALPNWPATRLALAQAPARYIRVNRLKTNLDALQQRLTAEGIQTKRLNEVPTALEVTGNAALFKTTAFREGWFEQQDAGSQLVALQLDVQPGMRVIDACAGAGGKSLLLAAQMKGRGRVLSMDIEAWKLDALKERAKRAGAACIETRLITSSKTIKRLADSADRLLLDVPCSGTGVLKRNPEGKWRHQPEHLTELLQLQADILRRYSKMLKPGGQLVYATCSVLPCENEQQVAAFLAEHPEFSLVRDQLLDPAIHGWDGFYYAVLVRNCSKASNKPAVSPDN